MGFRLHGLLTVDRGAIALYERLIPGGSAWVVPVTGDGLPDAWVLPEPAHVDDGLGNAATMAAGWFADEADAAWRAAAGVPAGDAPVDALDVVDLRLASLLSLAAPAGVVYLADSTFGGVLDLEYAAAFQAGVLRAAAGIRHGSPAKDGATQDGATAQDVGLAFELRDGAYAEVKPAEISPIADCAAVLDQRFRGASLFDGYLPRSVYPDTPNPPGTVTADAPALDAAVVEAWGAYFPLLRA